MWESRREWPEERAIGEAKRAAAEFGPHGWRELVIGERVGEHMGGEEVETGLDVVRETLLGRQVLLFKDEGNLDV